MENTGESVDKPVRRKFRWYRITPERFFVGLLIAEGLLSLSEWMHWFALDERKGNALLVAVSVFGVALLILLFWLIAALVFRWQFQYSVRSLLLMTVIVALLCSWFAAEMGHAKRQRQIVENLRKIGCVVNYDGETQSPNGIHTKNSLAPKWLQDWLGVDFFGQVSRVVDEKGNLTDEKMACLKDLPHLKYLGFSNSQITDAALESLEDLTELQTLDFRPQWADYPDGHSFVVKITDAGLAHLSRLTQVTSLGLLGCQINGSGLKNIQGMTHLKTLNLQLCPITDDNLVYLKDLKEIEGLYFLEAPITDAGLKHLKALPKLRELHLHMTRITDAGLTQLCELKQLQILWLGDTKITDAGLINLPMLPLLKELRLDGTRVTDAGLERLGKLNGLQSLWLGRTDWRLWLPNEKITDVGVKKLKALHQLKSLWLWGTKVTAEGVRELQRELPNLTEVHHF
jgi:hypothetical protein